MSHSNSSLNCFATCMAKYEHQYILHTPTCRPVSPHLTFGIMAHDTLHKAGILRDAAADRVVSKEDYYPVIPSEILYPELKSTFNIKSWQSFFVPVIKQTAAYENELVKELLEQGTGVVVERERKLQCNCGDIQKAFPDLKNAYKITQSIVGIIDLLIMDENHNNAVIIDYKFSNNRKTQDDFDLNSQLPLYAFLVHTTYGVPIRNIKCGYIDIPKTEFGTPVVLTNGTLSRAKSQNVSQEMYEKAVKAVHGDDDYYTCEEGGYYHDVWNALALNKAAYLSIQYLDREIYKNVIQDLIAAAAMIDDWKNLELAYLKKYDSYNCKNCEFLDTCKPWLGINDFLMV